MMGGLSTLQLICVFALPVLFAITLHEAAHAYVAYKLGDPTAYQLGRVSFNPLHHLDLIGSVLVPIVLYTLGGFILGWARPVPIRYSKLKHPKRDSMLVAAAGPMANLLMAILWACFGNIGLWLLPIHHDSALAIIYMGLAGIMININLMIFNLLPIPPLDGSRILAGFLSAKAELAFWRLEPYGMIIILVLLASGALLQVIGPLILSLDSSIINFFLPIPPGAI